MSRREHGGAKSAGADDALRQEAAVYLSAEAEEELTQLLHRREGLEAALQRMDVEVYNLESDFLKHCIAHGGSLFDGYGLERHANAHRNPVTVLTPFTTASSSGSAAAGGHASALPSAGASALGLGGGGGRDGLSVSALDSPLLATSTADDVARVYRVLTSCFDSSGGAPAARAGEDAPAPPLSLTAAAAAAKVGGSDGGSGAVFHVTSKGPSAPAFHYRLHFFSPSERVFSACSVGALSRVELAKASQAGSRGVTTASAWSTAAAAAAVGAATGVGGIGRGQGTGKRGRRGSCGAVSGAFDRVSDAPPSRRRPRAVVKEEEGEDGSDDAGEYGAGPGSRRRRQHYAEE